MSDDFLTNPFLKNEFERAKDSLEKTLEIAKHLLENLPKDSEIRMTSIMIGASFELIFDVILEFRFSGLHKLTFDSWTLRPATISCLVTAPTALLGCR